VLLPDPAHTRGVMDPIVDYHGAPTKLLNEQFGETLEQREDSEFR